ncbi:dNA-binding helix-turn-helix protein [Clostridium sp. CAG:269]|nr:dNA-binding helix-turn-helix protein [Clostridium sp. CAG:269]
MREKLIEIRTKKGYTQEQMANELSVARTTYTGYEKGNVAPSLEVALNIKKILKYKNDDIFLNSDVSVANTK